MLKNENEKYDENQREESKKRDDADDDCAVWFSNEAVIGHRPAVNKDRDGKTCF